MLDTIFATKIGMTQAWSKQGKRLAVTKCRIDDNVVLSQLNETQFEIGYGRKKLNNVPKPLREKIKKSGFSFGVKQVRGLKLSAMPEGAESPLKVGGTVAMDQVLEIGDVVKVQGTSKGRGFAGAVKRHGFHGGPKTHGQSDRTRAVGAISSGTTPGRIWRGKRMPGHFGAETQTVRGLVVLYLNPETHELWLSGPVPGHIFSILKISKLGRKKVVELDLASANLQETNPATEQPTAEEKKVEESKQTKAESKDQVEKTTQEEEKKS